MRSWARAEVSVYDRLVWPDGAVEKLLASGERRRELVAYFGEQEYEALVPLAQQALRARVDPDHVAFLVPGIMGSQLGVLRPTPHPPNLLWIDPADFHAGALTELSLRSGTDIRPLGVVLHTYLRLKLHLMAANLTVRCFDYDWRLSIAESARRLAAALAAADASRIGVVGHSMGGLVARHALRLLEPQSAARAARVRIVALATPQLGSFAVAQALRGSYATVRRIAQLDPLHSADALVERAFRTFPSLYEMLPATSADGAPSPDLRSAASWPASGATPDTKLLGAAERIARLFSQPDERVRAIAGVSHPTVTGLSLVDGEFVYRVTRDGDGTVPASFASLPGQPTWYALLAHSELPRDATVAAAVTDLLREGETFRLPTTATRDTTLVTALSDTALHTAFTAKMDWPAMTPAERHTFMDTLNSPAL